jgi:ectoine hydroxylase-related dioxygenase (phytanoyl-CoA dioxygenase family)
VPGFHHRIEGWLKSLPPGANPREQDLKSLGAKPIAAEAGDLIIWHHALPHGSSPNCATRPRMVHYLTMFPAVAEPERDWL